MNKKYNDNLSKVAIIIYSLLPFWGFMVGGLIMFWFDGIMKTLHFWVVVAFLIGFLYFSYLFIKDVIKDKL